LCFVNCGFPTPGVPGGAEPLGWTIAASMGCSTPSCVVFVNLIASPLQALLDCGTDGVLSLQTKSGGKPPFPTWRLSHLIVFL
jgi:hypothetical protein